MSKNTTKVNILKEALGDPIEINILNSEVDKLDEFLDCHLSEDQGNKTFLISHGGDLNDFLITSNYSDASDLFEHSGWEGFLWIGVFEFEDFGDILGYLKTYYELDEIR